ncbi:lipoprotein and hemagglutinin (VlhA) family protein [Mycoplasmoides gallisepticum]|nr:lipoprotein and hemagglutinin (VlhA) family protein [Mycoplasmoides gallisepticum]
MNGTTGAQAAMQTANKTIRLMKGLNKVIIGGTNNKDTPYIGNLVFTLSTSMPASNSNTASEAKTSGSPSSNGVQAAA